MQHRRVPMRNSLESRWRMGVLGRGRGRTGPARIRAVAGINVYFGVGGIAAATSDSSNAINPRRRTMVAFSESASARICH